MSHPIFKAIMKLRNRPSITAIKNLNNNAIFDFCRVSVQDVVKEKSYEKLLNLQVSLLKY